MLGRLVATALVVSMCVAGPVGLAQRGDTTAEEDAAYRLREASDVWISWDRRREDGQTRPEPTVRELDREDTYVGVTVGNARSTPIHNVTFVVTDTPEGVQVEGTEHRAGVVEPSRAAFWPRQGAGETAPVGVSIDTSDATSESGDLSAMVIFQDANGTRHAAAGHLAMTFGEADRAPGGTVGLGLAAGLAAAVLLAGRRQRT